MNYSFNEAEWAELLDHVGGWLPEAVLPMYKRGKEAMVGPESCFARFMPLNEAILTNTHLEVYAPQAGRIAWLCTDSIGTPGQLSNFAGVYVDGPLKGFMTILNHEEVILTPAYRSVSRLMDYITKGTIDGLIAQNPELPLRKAEPSYLEQDRALVKELKKLASEEPNKGWLWEMCALCLTPMEDSGDLLELLNENRTDFIPILTLRSYSGGIPVLEKYAIEHENCGSLLMRHFVALETDEAKEAVDRLKLVLTGQRLTELLYWEKRKSGLYGGWFLSPWP